MKQKLFDFEKISKTVFEEASHAPSVIFAHHLVATNLLFCFIKNLSEKMSLF